MNLKPDWLDNLFFLAKSHLANGDKHKAVQYLKKCVESHQQNENDEEEPEALKEAKVLLKKYGK